jgi:hypothetical protein
VKPPRGIAVEGSSVWKKTLVGHFVGPKLSYSAAVNPIAFKLWGKWGFNLVGVLSSENGFYFFKFSSEEHLLSVLDRAPWHMANRPLVLKRWHPTLSFQSSSTPSPVVTQRGITENSFMGSILRGPFGILDTCRTQSPCKCCGKTTVCGQHDYFPPKNQLC